MKAKIKGTTEWKDYKEVFGQYGEFMGLETKGYQLTDEEWCKERGLVYYPDPPLNVDHYISAILPLEAFDLPNEVDWQSFRNQAAKDILAGMMQHKVLSDSSTKLFVPKEQVVSAAIGLADELIKQLKEKEEK